MVAAALSLLIISQVGGPPPEIRMKFVELQEIQAHVRDVQEKTIKANPKLKKEVDAFQKKLEGAMVKKDPTLGKDLKRFKKLEGDFQKAMDTKDRAAATKIGPEIEPLARKLAQAQIRALEDPKLRAQAEAMEKRIQAAMKKIDPNVASKVARAEQLKGEIQAAMALHQGGDFPGGPPNQSMPPPR